MPSNLPSTLRRSSARARHLYNSVLDGVDGIGNSRIKLYAQARALDIPGRSTMSKAQLAQAISRKQMGKKTRKTAS